MSSETSSSFLTSSPAAPAGGANLLVELLTRLSAADGAAEAAGLAVSGVLTMLEADFAALVSEESVTWVTGLSDAEAAHSALLQAGRQGLRQASVPGFGAAELAAAPLTGARPSWLVAGRRPGTAYSDDDRCLLTIVGRALELHLRLGQATQQERGLVADREREARQRRRAERALAHQALHDRLTGLPNRGLVRDRAKRALGRRLHGNGFVAALFVDIDHFKLANDSLDHRRGDKLIVLIAQRLAAVLGLEENSRRGCTLARQGGDEFIVLCEELGAERDAVTMAQQIHDVLRAPFFIDGQEVQLTASIGIACTGAEEGRAPDADELLRDADVALSRAKERGRDRYEIFDEPMRARLLDRVALESDLRAGLERDEFVLHFQPVVSVADGSLAAVEALVRWEHPTRGLLAPQEFVPVAEESDLIVSIGTWVIEEACAQIRRWHEAHAAGLGVPVSVNVSARQLSPTLVEVVASALEDTGIPPSQLALEITESLLIEHTDSSQEVLAALKALGVSIVLDDFGTGYSSLGYLNRFPLGQLKLDRTFIAQLAHDRRSAKIVAATIDMARALGMTVVAEGVETDEQLAVLRRLGCDYAQGFLFAEPEPPEAIFSRIRAAYEHDREIAKRPAQMLKFSAGAALGAARPEDPRLRQRVAIGRLAGWLFLIGSLVALPSDLIIGAPSVAATVALTVMGLLTGLGCLIVPWHRLAEGWLMMAGVVATIEITVSVVALGRYGAVLQPIYLLIATAAAYAFHSRRVIAVQLVLVAAAMTVPAWRSDSTPARVALTLVSILVLVAICVVIAYLRELLEGSAAELRELAGRDPLTEVGNYRLLHERLESELSRHEREDSRLAVLLIDLDRFKQVNERRGHAAGDDVLRRVARTLRETVRVQDTVARQGGDEFAVLAPNTDAEGAAMLAARIRNRLSRVQFAGDSIGATVGFAIFPDHGRTPGELLTHADEELMANKLHPQPASRGRGLTDALAELTAQTDLGDGELAATVKSG
ncbi:MAG TPA: EAL domain-containing protein [Solirubrobacteraceae bacterium]